MKLKNVIASVAVVIVVIAGALVSTAVDAAMSMSRPMSISRPITISRPATISRPTTIVRPSTSGNTMMNAAVIMMLMNSGHASVVAEQSGQTDLVNQCKNLESPETDPRCVQLAEAIQGQ